jgi:hypothetical protein
MDDEKRLALHNRRTLCGDQRNPANQEFNPMACAGWPNQLPGLVETTLHSAIDTDDEGCDGTSPALLYVQA